MCANLDLACGLSFTASSNRGGKHVHYIVLHAHFIVRGELIEVRTWDTRKATAVNVDRQIIKVDSPGTRIQTLSPVPRILATGHGAPWPWSSVHSLWPRAVHSQQKH